MRIEEVGRVRGHEPIVDHLGLHGVIRHFLSLQLVPGRIELPRPLEIAASGISTLSHAIHDGLGRAFIDAVELVSRARGRVIVTGMGKSGHVGRKIAATLASTGTPAFFVHPSEASHGDLGMITPDDVIMALSW